MHIYTYSPYQSGVEHVGDVVEGPETDPPSHSPVLLHLHRQESEANNRTKASQINRITVITGSGETCIENAQSLIDRTIADFKKLNIDIDLFVVPMRPDEDELKRLQMISEAVNKNGGHMSVIPVEDNQLLSHTLDTPELATEFVKGLELLRQAVAGQMWRIAFRIGRSL